MKYGVFALTLLGSICVSSLQAQEGIPTRSKLERLGLGSMRVASSEAGDQVRGKFFFSYSFTVQSQAGGTTDGPYVFSNSFGTPLTYDPPMAPVIPLPFVVTGSASASESNGDTFAGSTSNTLILGTTGTFNFSFPPIIFP